MSSKQRKREKALFDLRRAEAWTEEPRSCRRRPTGMVNILPNFRSGSMFGGQQEFRQGDRAWPGRRSSSCRISRRSTSKRVSTNPIAAGCKPGRTPPSGSRRSRDASSRRDSTASRCWRRVDFTSGWPPAKNFDLESGAHRRGSANAPGHDGRRADRDRARPDVVLVPSEAIFQRDGAPVVYKLTGSMFVETPDRVTSAARNRRSSTAGVEPAIA